MAGKGFCALLVAALVSAPLVRATQAAAQAAPSMSLMADRVGSDAKYLVNNTVADAISVATSPLHIGEAGSLFTNPRFYLVIGGAGALFGGAFALDQTMRSHLRAMSSSDATLLQNVSYGSVSGATFLLWGYGLYTGDDEARHYALTAGEGAGVATLLDVGIKAAFGRLRPYQSSSHTSFFHGGQSFVSGDVTPMFGLAAGVSEYFNNRWYVAVPVYSLALLDGFGRMGHDAHWFSDVIGAALLGVGTTELLIWLHKRHLAESNTFWLFPVSPPPTVSRNVGAVPEGVGIAFSW